MPDHLSLFRFQCAARAFPGEAVHKIGIGIKEHHPFIGFDAQIAAVPMCFSAPDRVNHALNQYGGFRRLHPEAAQRVHHLIGAKNIEHGVRNTTQRDEMSLFANLEFFVRAANAFFAG